MTNNLPPRVVSHRGMTLLELTLTISVLLLMITVLVLGTRAWKRGSDRAGCVLTLRNIQMAARSYQNLYGYNYGGRPFAENGTQHIATLLWQKGYIEKNLYDKANGLETCDGGGTYTCPLPDIFPPAGELYLKCSLSETEDHQPGSHADW